MKVAATPTVPLLYLAPSLWTGLFWVGLCWFTGAGRPRTTSLKRKWKSRKRRVGSTENRRRGSEKRKEKNESKSRRTTELLYYKSINTQRQQSDRGCYSINTRAVKGLQIESD